MSNSLSVELLKIIYCFHLVRNDFLVLLLNKYPVIIFYNDTLVKLAVAVTFGTIFCTGEAAVAAPVFV